MKTCYLLAAALLIVPACCAQEIEKVQPSGKTGRAFLAMPENLAREVSSTARDLITARDQRWTLLTIAQTGAGIADVDTSLNNLHACATCREVGEARFFVGEHPDAHKYIIGGLVEIGVEAVAAHYLRWHGPIHKWYWRYLWTLPQSISLYEHARSADHNAGLKLNCDPSGLHCN